MAESGLVHGCDMRKALYTNGYIKEKVIS